jgi:hypothetical protein
LNSLRAAVASPSRNAGFVNPFLHGESTLEALAAAITQSRDYLLDCRQQTLNRPTP